MLDKIYFIESKNTNPYRNLAAEEYLTRHVCEGECVLFLWQNEKSVVVGKNQNIYAECDLKAMGQDGVHPVRRLSGGGAVYHDPGNLNFSFCVRSGDYDIEGQSEVILKAVNALGADAHRTGRNDLTVDGKKFSGHAFYKSGDNCCHHGTLLIDTDPCAIEKYLTPDSEKLAIKGIKSVKSRVMNLSDIVPGINTGSLSEKLVQSFSDTFRLPIIRIEEDSLDAGELQKKENAFASEAFIYGENVTFTHRIKKRFPWGGVDILLTVTDGIITHVQTFSDCMDSDLPGDLNKRIEGRRYDEEDILSLLDRI